MDEDDGTRLALSRCFIVHKRREETTQKKKQAKRLGIRMGCKKRARKKGAKKGWRPLERGGQTATKKEKQRQQKGREREEDSNDNDKPKKEKKNRNARSQQTNTKEPTTNVFPSSNSFKVPGSTSKPTQINTSQNAHPEGVLSTDLRDHQETRPQHDHPVVCCA